MTWNHQRSPAERKRAADEWRRDQAAAEARAADRDFYDTPAWLRLRYAALQRMGAHCQCCGHRSTPDNPAQVDHIKPRSKYPELQLDASNVQVLCRKCNQGKGNWDETDWRSQSARDRALRDMFR